MELSILISECKRQQMSAQKCLFDHFASRMFLLCRRYLKSDVEAEEAMMNGFLKVFSNIHKLVYTNDGATVAWFKRIMINECLMLLRQRNSFLQMVEDLPELAIQDETILSKLNTDAIFLLITHLPIGYRTVFNLFAIEGYSHKEIAGMLGITEGTSKSQLCKARATIQNLLEQNEEQDAHAIAQ